ncbi:MAG: TniQ family protein [Ruminococcus sp.]|nr:TniQ family protein [Ruminococcus sp.]
MSSNRRACYEAHNVPLLCKVLSEEGEIKCIYSIVESYGYYYNHFQKGLILPDPDRRLRYCPVCAADDREKYGETYWHRVHQIPEISVCAKHRCRLVSAKYKINNR